MLSHRRPFLIVPAWGMWSYSGGLMFTRERITLFGRRLPLVWLSFRYRPWWRMWERKYRQERRHLHDEETQRARMRDREKKRAT